MIFNNYIISNRITIVERLIFLFYFPFINRFVFNKVHVTYRSKKYLNWIFANPAPKWIILLILADESGISDFLENPSSLQDRRKHSLQIVNSQTASYGLPCRDVLPRYSI